jgi:hypothetical protein
VRGAAKLLADTLGCARRAGASGSVLVRADSAFYGHDIIATCRRVGARFSITARQTPAVSRAIAAIAEPAWTPIRYRHAIYDEVEQRWISDAEVADVPFTAFTGRRKAEDVAARLIVRRVRRLNPNHHAYGSSVSGSGRGAVDLPVVGYDDSVSHKRSCSATANRRWTRPSSSPARSPLGGCVGGAWQTSSADRTR